VLLELMGRYGSKSVKKPGQTKWNIQDAELYYLQLALPVIHITEANMSIIFDVANWVNKGYSGQSKKYGGKTGCTVKRLGKFRSPRGVSLPMRMVSVIHSGADTFLRAAKTE